MRTMSLTAELVAACHRDEPDEGRHPEFTPLADHEYPVLVDRLVAESHPHPLWIFAYGSLIWNPAFPIDETRRATAFGWHRSFCMELHNWRGSRQQPGLMMALDNGGRCNGIAYRIAEADRANVIGHLVDIEINAVEDVASIRWLPVATQHGPVRALAFYVGPRGPGIRRGLPLEEVGHILAHACGHKGSGAEYLYHTVRRLKEHGIRDRNLWRLQQLTAEAIVNRLRAEGKADR